MPKTTLLGTGAMSTAVGMILASRGDQRVTVWGRNADYIQELNDTRVNRKYLPGISIPDSIEFTPEFEQAIDGSELLVVGIPTVYMRDTLSSLAPLMKENRPVVTLAKGIERSTLMRPSEIIAEVLGARSVVALSGPSHAEEISRGLPTAVVAASGNVTLAKQVQKQFSTERFRVYTNPDIIGVELAGALKNVLSLAAGASDGLGFGDNAKAGLLTRGIVEMKRFGKGIGAESSTFDGLAGIGDMITSCVSSFGRNRAVGEAMGRGEKLDDILAKTEQVAEGVWTTKAAYELSQELGVEMPITTEVYRVLYEGKDPMLAVTDLMARDLTAEMSR